MYCTLPSPFLFFLMGTLNVMTEAKNQTKVKVPYRIKVDQPWTWSWNPTGNSKWKYVDSSRAKPLIYYACDTNPTKEPNMWLRSHVFQVDDAKRVDVTVEYAVSNCSALGYRYCKESLELYVHKTSIKYIKPDSVTGYIGPDPAKKPKLFEIFGTTNPKVLTVGSISKAENTETYSFPSNSLTPYYYLAIRSRGGCFQLYGATVSYSLCSSEALSSSLVQLPQTIAPENGSIQVSGSCPEHSRPLSTNATLYGYCKADGEWSTNMDSGECWCDAGYGKYSVGSGAECKGCPENTYQNVPTNSECKNCSMNSEQGTNRTRCECKKEFYRADNETIFDNCTAQPSRPRYLKSTFFNATFMAIEWTPPANLGGRLDVYYEVECKQCNEKGQDCTKDCTGAVITHTPSTTRMATVKHLSAYTYYQITVFAKNGVTSVAEKNNEESAYSVLPQRTKETVPGKPKLTVTSTSSTSANLKWTVSERNGIITYFQVTYYPTGEVKQREVFNTTAYNAIINDLKSGKTYIFQVRASTSCGLGQAGEVKGQIDRKHIKHVPSVPKQIPFGSIAAGVVVFLISVIIVLVVCLYKRRRRLKLGEGKTNMGMELLPMDGHRMYIDPSTYGSPMEALMSNTEEIGFQNIKLEKNIGGGEFADVYKGILTHESETEVVAVKILKVNASYKSSEDFILEASIMGQFKHPNVIELKGVVTRSPDTPMMIVTEFMENGSLEHFLKLHDGQLLVLQLVGIARGVAAGMAYLSEMNFIHRDLAARNILLTDNMAAKVADFGLSRELDDSEDNPDSEYTTQGGKIAVRWTAPESIRYRKFSSASDVWSFGILLWETMSFAERPYWEWDNFQVMDRVEAGFRLPAPMGCPKAIHNVMLDCWEAEKSNRPKFPEIVQRLEDMIRSPEKMTDDSQNSRYSNTNESMEFKEETTVENWLDSINMGRYANLFTTAGYVELCKVKSMEEEDVSRIGVKLIGHRNKINKSIKAMNRYFELSPNNEPETD